jgi:tRNA pseudouridine55 synthase
VTDDAAAVDGVVIVDKSSGWTSHDVVARIRRLAGTRRVGHAGTLDPMATGVLVVGVNAATRLLGYLAGHDKDYDATIRLGVTTTTDDAEGDVVTSVDATHIEDVAVHNAMGELTGDIQQVPSAVSAIKVGGERAYAKVRRGESVDLAARAVRVEQFALLRRNGSDLDVHVRCSSGTYVRALARDLGAALGVGAHLTALRRTRVGGFGLDGARTIDELSENFSVIPLADVVALAFPRWDVDETIAARLAHGQRLAPVGLAAGPTGVFGPGGGVIGLVEERDDAVRPVLVFPTRDMS